MINKEKFWSICLMTLPLFTWLSCKNEVYDQMLADQQKENDSIRKTVDGKFSKMVTNKFETIRYQGCEYLVYKEVLDNNSEMGFMAHKGNCGNPIHKPALDCYRDTIK